MLNNGCFSKLYIHRYDLSIKAKACTTEEEDFKNILNCLQKFFNIAIQADRSSIPPPYF
jgi:hypothetical protein